MFIMYQTQVGRPSFSSGYSALGLSEQASISPRLDVLESPGEIVYLFEMPGVENKDMIVEVGQGEVVVGGWLRLLEESDEKTYRHKERALGRYYRVAPLPPDVDEQQVQADYKLGILHVRLPRSKDQSGKVIVNPGTGKGSKKD